MSTENEIEKRGPGRPPKEVPFDAASFMKEMMTQMTEANRETLVALASELRKPTELEQKKLDEEKESIRKRTINAIAAAKQGEEQILGRQASCNHMQGRARTNGYTAFTGQVNSDGYIVPRCQKCYVQALPLKATAQELQGSVNLWEWQSVTLEGLNRMAIMRDPSVAPNAEKVA